MGCDAVGVDLAETALSRARAYKDPERGSVNYLLADILDPSNGIREASFDYVFEHTCFCAIDPEQRRNYVQSAKHWLVPGGKFLGLFFTDPPPREDGGAGPPFGMDLQELRGLFGEVFTITSERSPDRSHPDRLGREVIIEMVRNP